MTLVIGTRGSRLALTQTRMVSDQLRQSTQLVVSSPLDLEIKTIATTGDRMIKRAVSKIGDKGLFVKELETALLTGAIDLAVHSAKDVPSQLPEGLVLAAFLTRGDVRDALVVCTSPQMPLNTDANVDGLNILPLGARVGTSSLRRMCQLRALRPDLRVEDIRGNVDTRLRALDGQFDALLLAAAGLERLGFIERTADGVPIKLTFETDTKAALFAIPLSTALMVPAVAQGTLVIECRAQDTNTRTLVGRLNDTITQLTAMAERAFLRRLEGGCQVPIAAYAHLDPTRLHLSGLVGSADGTSIVRGETELTNSSSLDDAEELGLQLAEQLLNNGAREILADLRRVASRESQLVGMRVIVTRAEGHNAGLSTRLSGMGAEPIEYPVIAYAPPEDMAAFDLALQQLTHGTFDWLVMTSATAVETIAIWLRRKGMHRLGNLRIAVIGPATADACARLLGQSGTLMPNAFNGANLAAALQAANVRGQHALLLNADIANSKLQTVLEEAGLRVSRVIAYRTIAAPTHAEVDVPTLIEKGWAHALTFTSPSTVRHFIERLSPTTLEAAKRLLAVCIGPTTAYAAHTAGFTSVIVAETATEDSLVEALAEASRSTLKRP